MEQRIQILTTLLLLAILSLFCQVSGASSESFTNALYSGQNKMYTIQVPCTATLSLQGGMDAQYAMYAKKAASTWIPSADYVMRFPDVSSKSSGTSLTLYLDSGDWFVVVVSKKGFGEYTLTVDKDCPITTNCKGGPCCNPSDAVIPSAYLSDVAAGFLNAGESKTYAYRFSGNRSYAEWLLNGPCDTESPVMQSKKDIELFTTKNCAADFDLYLYSACNPKYFPCTAVAADLGSGSNAYVGVSAPEVNQLYYAKVYAKHGSGTYRLTARSYTNTDITIAGIEPAEYTGYVSSADDVHAPDDLNQTIPVPPTAYTIKASEL